MDTIKKLLDTKDATISFEVFPPKKEGNLDGVISCVKELSKLSPDFISVTYGAGGSTRGLTSQIARSIIDANSLPLAHLTCVGESEEDLLKSIEKLISFGVKNVLALRGDLVNSKGEKLTTIPGFSHASDLVKLLKKWDFCIGGACYPEGHPEAPSREEDMDLLKYKVEAGVDFLTTQMFFDNDMLYQFLYRLQSKGIHTPVIAGIMPITRANQVTRMIRLSNAFVPRRLLSICDRYENKSEALFQAGIAYATEQIIDLLSNHVRGIHIYTMNQPKVALAIMANILHIIR